MTCVLVVRDGCRSVAGLVCLCVFGGTHPHWLTMGAVLVALFRCRNA